MFLRHLKPNTFQTKPSSVPPSPGPESPENHPLTSLLPLQTSARFAYSVLTRLTLIPSVSASLVPPSRHSPTPVQYAHHPSPRPHPISLQSSLQTAASDISREDLTMPFHSSFYSLNKYLLGTYYISITLLGGEPIRSKTDKKIPASWNPLFKTILCFQEETKNNSF